MLEHLQSVPPWLVAVVALSLFVVAIGIVGLMSRGLQALTAMLQRPFLRV